VVHPTLIHTDHVLASVRGVFNAALVSADMAGDTLYYGRGAGREPTASTVIGDVADIIRNVVGGSARRFSAAGEAGEPLELMAAGDVTTRYYIRLDLRDRPGVLARVAAVLGEHDISLASVLQQEGGEGEHVPVVIITHEARERECDAALQAIGQLDVVGAAPVRIRIEV